MKKKLLSWMLVLLLLLSVMPQGVFAEDEGGIVVSVGVYDYTALTYDEALAVSDNGSRHAGLSDFRPFGRNAFGY